MILEVFVYLLLVVLIVLSPLIWFLRFVALPAVAWLLTAGILGTAFVYLPLRAGLRLVRPLLPPRSAVDACELAAIGAAALPVVLYSMCWLWALPWPAMYHGAFFDAMRFVGGYAARVPVVWPLLLIERVPIPYAPRNFAVAVEMWALLFMGAAALDLIAAAVRAVFVRGSAGGGMALAVARMVLPVRFGWSALRPLLPPKDAIGGVEAVLFGLVDGAVVLYSLVWPWVVPWPATYHDPFFSVMRTAFNHVSRLPVVWPLSLVERIPLPYLPHDFAVGVEAWVLMYASMLVIGLLAILVRIGFKGRGARHGDAGHEGPAEDGPEAEMA